jgi:hypothetical protein
MSDIKVSMNGPCRSPLRMIAATDVLTDDSDAEKVQERLNYAKESTTSKHEDIPES